MGLIYLFSTFLIVGMFFSQIVDLSEWRSTITFITSVLLAYIMMEVGLEFVIDKKRWKAYIKDYLVAMLAAGLPWLFCFIYYLIFFEGNGWTELLLIARFAAPTSSGILFSMLAAAGLAMTWLFRKVQILAILDDVDTMLLLIPLQFLLGGTLYALLSVVVFIVILVFLAWKFLHRLTLPVGRFWLLLYAIILSFLLRFTSHLIEVELEILLPAFVFGCLLYNPHDPRITKAKLYLHEHAYIEPEERPFRIFDRILKAFFMLMVGLLLPKVHFNSFNIWILVAHVLVITFLSNLGKCFPIFCYKKEASLSERIAVCFAMFPRGEVGAGILVLAIEHGIRGYPLTVSVLSLALNLLLTGVFITIVIELVKKKYGPKPL
ncbi:MAG: cation:proton antiporter [Chlamydiales bacterium]